MTDHSAEFENDTPPADSSKHDLLQRLLEEAIGLEQAVAQTEADLKAMKASLNLLKSNRIPDLMDEMRITSQTFRGWKVDIADFVSGSLPKEEEAHKKAIAWLEANGAGGLIKTEVSLSFGRSQHNEALDVAGSLIERGFAPNVKSGVHAQTLAAFARQRIKDGDPIDVDTLGLFIGKVAKIKPPTDDLIEE